MNQRWLCSFHAQMRLYHFLPTLMGGEGHISSSTLVFWPKLSTNTPISVSKQNINDVIRAVSLHV
jgi:hypothetical protein